MNKFFQKFISILNLNLNFEKKFYHVSRGHSQGEIEQINLLISSHGLYILTKNQINNENSYNQTNSSAAASATATSKIYKKETFINHKQIDYVEVCSFFVFLFVCLFISFYFVFFIN
jgi:hypothetical protein